MHTLSTKTADELYHEICARVLLKGYREGQRPAIIVAQGGSGKTELATRLRIAGINVVDFDLSSDSEQFTDKLWRHISNIFVDMLLSGTIIITHPYVLNEVIIHHTKRWDSVFNRGRDQWHRVQLIHMIPPIPAEEGYQEVKSELLHRVGLRDGVNSRFYQRYLSDYDNWIQDSHSWYTWQANHSELMDDCDVYRVHLWKRT